MRKTTLAVWKQALKRLEMVLFAEPSSQNPLHCRELLGKLGIDTVKVMPFANLADLVPQPGHKLYHVYALISDSDTQVSSFMGFAKDLYQMDERPYYWVLTQVRIQPESYVPFFTGHMQLTRTQEAADVEQGLVDVVQKVLLQEQAAHWHQQWQHTKRLSDELNAEAFQFQQEQNEVIRLTKLLSEKLNPKDVAKAVCEVMGQVFGVETVGFLNYDELADVLRLEHAAGTLNAERIEKGIPVNVRGKREPLAHFEQQCQSAQMMQILKDLVDGNQQVQSFPTVMKDGIIGMFFLAGNSLDKVKPHLLDQMMQAFAVSYQNAQLHDKISNLAIRDGLTGLHNVRYFHERVAAEFNRMERLKHPLGLIFLDIDHFKHYNDTNGHPNGDKVIKQVAELIVKVFRPTDLIARYGGEEFVIAMPHAYLEDAAKRAEELRELVEATPFPYEETQPLGKVTISVGVSAFPEIANDVKTLVKIADDCLYEVKQGGRNQVKVAQAPEGHVPLFIPRK